MSRKTQSLVYFAVQHSGFAYKGDERFARGLEPGACYDDKTMIKAIRDGAEMFRDYGACDEYCNAQQYPKDYVGLIPIAPGRFLDLALGDRKIYVGKKEPGK